MFHRVVIAAVFAIVAGAGLYALAWRPATPWGRLPELAVSDREFIETMAAHTSAGVTSGNLVELLLNVLR